MATPSERRALVVFHLVLGLGLMLEAVRNLVHAVGEILNHAGANHVHLAIVSGLQAVAALLFLIARTQRMGGIVLLVFFVGGWLMQAVRGQWGVELLIYAAGVWLVMQCARATQQPAATDGAA